MVYLLPALLLAAPVTEQQRPITGGVETEAWEAVVALETPFGLCTATLLTPRLALTAAHCLYDVADAAQLVLRSDIGDDSADVVARGARFALHPDFSIDQVWCATCTDINDIGYVLLDEEVLLSEPYPVLPAQSRALDFLSPGTALTLVGYGDDGNGVAGKREVATSVHRITAGESELWAGGDGNDACRGDSGGPALIAHQGRWVIAGVASRGGRCGDGGYFTIPDVYRDWLAADSGEPIACLQGGEDDECATPTILTEGCSTGGSSHTPGAVLFVLAALSRVPSRRRRRLRPS